MKIWKPIAAVVVLLVILFVLILGTQYKDSGTEVKDTFNEGLDEKAAFLEKANEIRKYSKNHLETALTQYELNSESYIVYEKWDALLNEVYQYLEKTLSESEFEQLREDELAWLSQKENAIDEAVAKWKGGSGEPLAQNMTAIHCTEERFNYLISLIK